MVHPVDERHIHSHVVNKDDVYRLFMTQDRPTCVRIKIMQTSDNGRLNPIRISGAKQKTT
jgi:hypothetical protein